MLDLRHRPKIIWIAAYAVVLNLIMAGAHIHLEDHGGHADILPISVVPDGHTDLPGGTHDGKCLVCWSQAMGASLLTPDAPASLTAGFFRQWRSASIIPIPKRFNAAAFHARAPPFRQFTLSTMS